jgi:hypothetical protein
MQRIRWNSADERGVFVQLGCDPRVRPRAASQKQENRDNGTPEVIHRTPLSTVIGMVKT